MRGLELRHQRATIEPGTLYVVATPIGNLGDISARALEVLRGVAWIAAEDTRHTRRLLRHFGITSKLYSLHEHNERSRLSQLRAQLEAGHSGALVSDAGTPLISDPGFPLVRELRRCGIEIRTVPGPSSVLAALSIAGLPCERFAIEGFLPARPGARRNRLETLQKSPYTLVFLESSHRIDSMLADLDAVFGADRPAFIGRELTKAFEESHTAPLGQLRNWLEQRVERRRGEFVVIVQGTPQVAAEQWERRRVLEILVRALPLRQAVALAAELTGARKNELYSQALALRDRHD